MPFSGQEVRVGFITRSVTSGAYARYLFEKGTLGPSVMIAAEDVHGNAGSDGYFGPSTYARFAEIVGNLPGHDVEIPLGVGELTPLESASAFAGFMYGVADSARGIYELGASAPSTAATLYDLVQHPQELADAVATVTAITRRLAERPELLREAAKSALEAVAETQRIQNPFGPGDPRHATFAMNWYGGFVAGHLYVEAALSLGVGVVVKRVENTFDTAKAIGDAVRSARAAVLAGTIGVTTRSAGFVARGIVRGTALSVHGVKAGLQRVSVARQFVVRSLAADLGDDAIRTIADGGFEGQFVEYLTVTGRPGLQTLNRIPSDRIPVVLGTLTNYRLTRALADGDVPIQTLRVNLQSIDLANSYPQLFFEPGNDALSYVLVRGRFTDGFENIQVGVRYAKEKQAFIDRYVVDAATPALRRGSVGEGVADAIAARKGYRVLGQADGFNKRRADDIGIDNIARTENGDFVVIEAKYTSNERIGYDFVETDAYGAEAQLDDTWLQGAVREMDNQGILSDDFPVDELRRQIRAGEVKKELTVVRDTGTSGQTLRRPQSIDRSLTEQVGIDSVEVVDLPPGSVDFAPRLKSQPLPTDRTEHSTSTQMTSIMAERSANPFPASWR